MDRRGRRVRGDDRDRRRDGCRLIRGDLSPTLDGRWDRPSMMFAATGGDWLAARVMFAYAEDHVRRRRWHADGTHHDCCQGEGEDVPAGNTHGACDSSIKRARALRQEPGDSCCRWLSGTGDPGNFSGRAAEFPAAPEAGLPRAYSIRVRRSSFTNQRNARSSTPVPVSV
jgi:hypothetical protein